MEKVKLILASGSPRRRELLAELGYQFEVVTSDAEEEHRSDISLVELCERNAEIKTQAVAKDLPEAVVLGGDTLVYVDQEPLGKPKDLAEAKKMLRRLSGREHHVCTGMCLIHGDRVEAFHEVSSVFFKEVDDATIDRYLEQVHVLDKAGSYAIQEHGDMLIERMEGDYSNVVGMPQRLVDVQLRSFGLQPEGL
ncbi:Maf family protein [Rubritalea tangerina]|uniref:dTTP/UTP pyrophosphatase n=1 Tax=Rubritalea tangerina TaxID=430798 RepID=A0ABW4ZC45_9BACT